MRLFIVFIILSFGIQSFGQEGIIRGEVFDGTTGESLPGVTILINDGSGKGTITDLDGNFSLKTNVGIQSIVISYISYQTISINDIVVSEDKVTVLDQIKLSEETIQIQEMVKTAKAVRNTETAILTLKQKSVNVLDGISASSLKQIGDGDVAASMKRVTGVSVVGGKYVYVRGLGDRYTKTILNGVDLPGLDPDRNSLQMDLFPTNIIDNVIVHKSFNPALPADFTGGVVDIELLDFPEKKKGSLSIGGGYNPGSHFNPNYVTYQGGSTDFLGFDDGTRDIPDLEGRTSAISLTSNDQQLMYEFTPTMAAIREKSFMDYSLNGAFGNQKQLDRLSIGYNLALSYKNTTDYYENTEVGKYLFNPNKNIKELDTTEYTYGDYGSNNVLFSVLAGLAFKTQRSKIRLNFLRIQNGESGAAIFDYFKSDVGTIFNGMEHDLLYSERSITNFLLIGNHTSKDATWRIEWKLSPTFSKVEDPDIRFTMYQDFGENRADSERFDIDTESGFPTRNWRDLSELNLAGILNTTKEFEFNDRKAKINFGGAYTYKNRDYSIKNFLFNTSREGNENIPFTGNPDEIFNEEYFWPMNGNKSTGISVETPFLPKNQNEYNAYTNNIAAYVSTDLALLKKLQACLGVRIEYYTHFYTGINLNTNESFNAEKMLTKLNFFPAVNLNYTATDKMNLRFSYSMTTARPSFKELSFVQIMDPITKTEFDGGLFPDGDAWDGSLTTTDIQNLDLRWEFFSNGFMSSVSGYYKYFKNPIEIVQYTSKLGAYQPRNVGDGQVYGAELELRFELNQLIEKFPNISINGNFTYTESRIEMDDNEYNSRVNNARTGQTIKRYRNMAGQSPYLVNGGISFNGAKKGLLKSLNVGLYYNVQGRTLDLVGIASVPDIYTEPFHSLNLTSSIALGKKQKASIGFKIKNILKSEKASTYDAFKADDPYYKVLDPGTTYSFSLSCKLF